MVTINLILGFSILFNLILGIYVLIDNHQNKTNILYFIFTLSISSWLGCTLCINLLTSRHYLNWVGKCTWAIGLMMPVTFVILFMYFPNTKTASANFKKYLVGLLPSFLLVILSFTNLIQRDVYISDNVVRPVYGPFFPIFAFIYMCYAVIALYLPIRKYFDSKDPFEKLQLKFTFFGIIIFAICAIFLLLILPIFLGSRPFFNGLAQSSSVVMTCFMAYAIVRYRFMNVLIVFRNFIHSLCNSILLAALIFLSLLIMSDYIHIFSFPKATPSIVFFSVGIPLLFVVFRTYLSRLIDKLFFRGHYQYQAALNEVSYRLSNLLDLRQLINLILKDLLSIFHCRSVFVCILEDSGNYWRVYSTKFTSKRLFDRFSNLYEFLRKNDDILLIEEFKRTSNGPHFVKLLSELESLNSSVVVPLKAGGRFIGFISLDEKLSLDIYSVEDIRFLSTLSHHLSTALENSKLYQKIVDLNNYNEQILFNLASAVIIFNKEETITKLNKKAKEILGYKDDLIGQSLSELPEPMYSALKGIIETKTILTNEEIHLTKRRNKDVYINLSTSLISTGKGEIDSLLVVFSDVSDIRQLEADKRRAERLATVGTLAAGMAHEIKNPLVSLKTFAQLLPSKFDDPEFRNSFSRIAIEEVERINNLVEQLLEFSRPSKPFFSVVNVLELIDESLLLVATQIENFGINLIKDLDERPYFIYGDKEQLKQVFINIFLNSIQALRHVEKRNLLVSINSTEGLSLPAHSISHLPEEYYLSDSALKIHIEDSGPGISKKNLKHVFDPFFTTNDKGYGLGLAIAHNITQDHFGSIEIESEVNSGTSVLIVFHQLFAKGFLEDIRDEILSDRIQ